MLMTQNYCSFFNADEVPVEWQCNCCCEMLQ